ncbi:MAG: hypothetical protein M1830_002240 [Pleopsidium flavum]|nr:MAG: hypothetical protein M1830_002240 [Pleopsidium flavum]
MKVESASSSSSSSGTIAHGPADYMTNPFTIRHGRRYLRDPTVPYPLPVDLPELHRQNLRTLMLMQVFGKPFCSPFLEDRPPKKILEIACGSALWSSACHDYLARSGISDASFTGLDIAPLAPDLNQRGINWRFVQHDLRRSPLPFPDGEFDLVFVKDTCFWAATAGLKVDPLSEPLRLVKPGGALEVWDSDYTIRTLLPYPPIAPSIADQDQEQAELTATYTTAPGTPFTVAQNPYLQDYNSWVEKALDKRRLTAVPCALVGLVFSGEPESLGSVGSRRMAIPFGEVRWEREGVGGNYLDTRKRGRRQLSTSGLMAAVKEDGKQLRPSTLNANQAALRRTALLTMVQMIESLEPMLKEASGKTQSEWDRWWAGMTTDLLEQKGTASGECLEIGAWWGQKQ